MDPSLLKDPEEKKRTEISPTLSAFAESHAEFSKSPLSQSTPRGQGPQFPLEIGILWVQPAMLEPQRVHRDADGDLRDAVTAPLLAHPPSPAEPSPATVGSPEITDEEIDAASAACCRICLESDSEPGEPPPPN